MDNVLDDGIYISRVVVTGFAKKSSTPSQKRLLTDGSIYIGEYVWVKLMGGVGGEKYANIGDIAELEKRNIAINRVWIKLDFIFNGPPSVQVEHQHFDSFLQIIVQIDQNWGLLRLSSSLKSLPESPLCFYRMA